MSDLKSAIYGLAVGDALGVPFEFKTRGSFNCTDMTGNGTHNQQAGTWSDDTSMTLATCSSIKDNGKKIVIEDIKQRFKYWLFDGDYTPNGDVFDFGITTSQSIRQGYGVKDINSNGNGSLMRILPLAFVDCTDGDIDIVSSITHAHDISKDGCRIYVSIAKKLIMGDNLKDIVQALKVSEVYSRLKKLGSLKEEEISSTGYVVHTLEASLWCLLNTNGYRDAVLKAVNLGDDTDTTGAVTGGLAGIMYGYSEIPENWIRKLQNKKMIDSCLF